MDKIQAIVSLEMGMKGIKGVVDLLSKAIAEAEIKDQNVLAYLDILEKEVDQNIEEIEEREEKRKEIIK